MILFLTTLVVLLLFTLTSLNSHLVQRTEMRSHVDKVPRAVARVPSGTPSGECRTPRVPPKASPASPVIPHAVSGETRMETNGRCEAHKAPACSPWRERSEVREI